MDQIPENVPMNQSDLINHITHLHEYLFLDKVQLNKAKAHDLVQFYLTRHQSDPKEFPIHKQLFDEIINFHKETGYMFEQLQDQKDWIHETTNQHFKMSYKLIPGTPYVSLKWDSVMKVPIINACALIYQTELFDQWVPFCNKSISIKQCNMGHKVAYMNLSPPIISNREAYIRGFGVDRLEQSKQFMICCKSIQNDKEYLDQYKIVIPKSKAVQVDVNFFTLQVTLIPEGFQMKCVANFDPKMSYIPQNFLNFCIKKIGNFIYERFVKLSQDIRGTKWEQQVQATENQRFYQHISKRVNQQ